MFECPLFCLDVQLGNYVNSYHRRTGMDMGIVTDSQKVEFWPVKEELYVIKFMSFAAASSCSCGYFLIGSQSPSFTGAPVNFAVSWSVYNEQ